MRRARIKAENKRKTFTSVLPNAQQDVEDADLALGAEPPLLARSAGKARMSLAQKLVETTIPDTEISFTVNTTVIEVRFLAPNKVEFCVVNKIVTRKIFQTRHVQPCHPEKNFIASCQEARIKGISDCR